MLPQINGVGTLAREPEQKFTNAGASIVSFGLAFNERYKTQDGSQKENVTFIDCTVFGALGEKVVMPYVHKGDKIYIVGKLKLDQWTAQDGSKRSKHSVTVESLQMLGNKDDSQQPQQNTPQPNHSETPNSSQHSPQPMTNIPEIDVDEYSIPF